MTREQNNGRQLSVTSSYFLFRSPFLSHTLLFRHFHERASKVSWKAFDYPLSSKVCLRISFSTRPNNADFQDRKKKLFFSILEYGSDPLIDWWSGTYLRTS